MTTGQNEAGRADASPPPLRAVPNIGIVGHSRAGKTVFIASLERALQWRDWNVSIDPRQGRYLRDLINILQSGKFLDKTIVQDRYERIEIIASKGARQFQLSLVDPAGELFETDHERLRPEERQARDTARQGLESNLAGCTGFIILLDLEHESETFTQTVNNFLFVVNASLARARTAGSGRAAGEKLNRVVVLFSKADLLPWQDRYRIRSAEDWVTDPRNKMEAMVRLVRNNFHEARFEFVSTIGWSQGMANLRTTLTPRPCNAGNRQTFMRGEHMPDPALPFDVYKTGLEDESQFRFMKAMPMFTDPLRISPYKLPEVESRNLPMAGVEFFPGRKEKTNTFSPWNVVEPLLWAAEATD